MARLGCRTPGLDEWHNDCRHALGQGVWQIGAHMVSTAASGGEVDQSLAEILSVAGHELTQPLTVALACARLMREPPPAGFSEDDKRHIQEVLERNLVQIESLLEDLEVLADLETLGDADSGPDAHWEPIAMGPVLKKAADDFSASHPHWDIELSCEGNLRVRGDLVRFRQVLSNLLGNAAKFGDRGTPIQLEGHAEGQDVIVTVHNEGVGFASEEAGNIFGKHARLAQKVEGRGWGLYVAKAIVEAHGGRLWAESEKSHGATFVISVPALPT